MHIMVMTRPDIAYAVGQVAQYAHKTLAYALVRPLNL